MTPRGVDIAYVLESVPGVRAVFAIAPGTKASGAWDFAVAHEQNGRTLAEITYALARVLGHDDIGRVLLFHHEAPGVAAGAMTPLAIDEWQRQQAKARVPDPPPAGPITSATSGANNAFAFRERAVLSVGPHRHVERAIAALHPTAKHRIHVIRVLTTDRAASILRANWFPLVLCDAERAFGRHGLLAKLPFELAQRVVVVAYALDLERARENLGGEARILRLPIDRERLRMLLAAGGLEPSLDPFPGSAAPLDAPASPAPARAPAPVPARRARAVPPADATFTSLLVGIDDDDELHEMLRRIVPEGARSILRRDLEAIPELLATTPFHLVVLGEAAALHAWRSPLEARRPDDRADANRMVVLSRRRDVRWVEHTLARRGLTARVLGRPVDEVILREIVLRAHPALVERSAVAALTSPLHGSRDEAAPSTPCRATGPRRTLVVDDDLSSRVLYAAREGREGRAPDVVFASTAVAALGHLLDHAAPFDALAVSASMRAEGGEPLYRVMWRLAPALKTRTLLITGDERADAGKRLIRRPLLPGVVESAVHELLG